MPGLCQRMHIIMFLFSQECIITVFLLLLNGNRIILRLPFGKSFNS